MKRSAIVAVLTIATLLVVGVAGASTPGADARLTNDCHPDAGCGAGYVSDYTLATGVAYTDQTLDECTISKGRENEPAVAVDRHPGDRVDGSATAHALAQAALYGSIRRTVRRRSLRTIGEPGD